MATNMVIAAPDFGRIQKLDPNAINDAITLLWYVLNDEASVRAKTVNRAQNRVSPKVQFAAPTTTQNDYDGGDTGTLCFTAALPFNLTGIRNGVDGRRYKLHNLGAGTVTIKYESGSSDPLNRFDTVTGADKTLALGQTADVEHLNGRWRLASFI